MATMSKGARKAIGRSWEKAKEYQKDHPHLSVFQCRSALAAQKRGEAPATTLVSPVTTATKRKYTRRSNGQESAVEGAQKRRPRLKAARETMFNGREFVLAMRYIDDVGSVERAHLLLDLIVDIRKKNGK